MRRPLRYTNKVYVIIFEYIHPLQKRSSGLIGKVEVVVIVASCQSIIMDCHYNFFFFCYVIDILPIEISSLWTMYMKDISIFIVRIIFQFFVSIISWSQYVKYKV